MFIESNLELFLTVRRSGEDLEWLLSLRLRSSERFDDQVAASL